MVNGTVKRSTGFFAATIIFLILTLMVLGYGLLHKSSEPQILGRYSFSYAVLLASIAFVALLLGLLLWRHPPFLVRWALNIYTFLISSLIVLGLTEVGLRVFNPWGIELFDTLPYHMQGMVDHPKLGYVHPKSVSYMLGTNRVNLNSHGLRDEEIPYTKPPDERRILALGDSVTFGWGVSQGETFSDILELLLKAETGKKWQVINAGVNGYNSEQEATYLRIEGMRYHPDIVILTYVVNDADPVIDPNITTWRRYPTWSMSFPELLERVRSLSYLYQLTRLFARMEAIGVSSEPANSDNSPSNRRKSITSQPGWHASLAALEDIASQCKNAHISFLVVKVSGNDPAFFASLLDDGIEAINLSSVEAALPEDQRNVSRIDRHPSAAFHAGIAKYLLDTLKVRGWLDP
jgi:hypothetical protein